MSGQPLSIDVISDVVCPWCFIGKRRLEKALQLAPQVNVELRWRPYQLAPELPQEGIPRDDYLKAKFGSVERSRQLFERVSAAGAEEGLAFAFDRITVSPNTRDAHRLILWSRTAGTQDAVVEALFRAYFFDGSNLADRDTLIAIGGVHGLDAGLLTELLGSDADIERTERDIASARKIGVTGVPFFIIGGRYGIAGAEAPETIAGALQQAAAEASETASA